MASETRHLRDEEIQEAVDGRLSSERMAPVEAHLRSCRECQATWEAFAWVRQQASRLPRPAPPDGLSERISRSLDDEDARAGRGGGWRRRPGRLLAIAGALAAMVAIAVLVAGRRDPVAAVARDHADLRAVRLALDLRTPDVKEMEAYFAGARLPFPVRVFDLGMMSYTLVGGKVHSVRGHPSALYVYRGPNGDTLICQMYEAGMADLPPGGEVHEHEGIRFVVYSRDGLTLVFWPEGRVVCVLVGEGGSDAILPLAFAKARAAARLEG